MVHSPQFREFVEGRYGIDPAHPFKGLPTAQPSPDQSSDLTRSQMAYRLGVAAPDQLEGRNLLGPVGSYFSSLGNDTLRSLLLGASFGALGGAGYGLGTGRKLLPAALSGSAVGGAGSAALSEIIRAWRTLGNPSVGQAKQAAAFSTDPLTEIRAALMADGSADSMTKTVIMRMLPQLTSIESSQLAAILRAAVGAGAAVLVARYLLRLGFVGSALSALVGGYAASRFGGTRNFYGQTTDTQADLFGRSRHVF